MKIKPRTIKHEKFKEMVKEWLDTHREEYCAFAEEVSRRDRSGFIQIFEYAQLAAPGYANVVMAKMSEKNPKDLDSIEKFLRDADIASTLVDGFQSQKPDSIVPAMLAWMYFGNSWETVVSYNEEMIQDKDTGLSDRIKARFMILVTIQMSIVNGHRTREDWREFRKIQKSMGSIVPITDTVIEEMEEERPEAALTDDEVSEVTDEKKEPKKRGRKKVRETLDNLIPDDTDRIKGKISEFLKLRSSGNDLAMLYIYLHEDSHIRSCDISTFHDALSEHYPEYKFVGLRGVQKAHQQLTTPMMGGKRMIDMGQDKKNLDNIRNHFEAA